MSATLSRILGFLLLASILAACSGGPMEPPGRVEDIQATRMLNRTDRDPVYLLGGPEKKDPEATGIGVNSFLWRASLDTMSFMPLVSADPFGGVIITDWFSPPEARDERFKVTVYILGRDLRADGIRASVFRQRQDGGGGWVDATVEQSTATDLENAILNRARQLRVASLQ